LSRLFSWLLEKRRVSCNPLRDVSAPKTSNDRDRVLTDAEIVAFWKACDDQPEPVRQCLRLLLLTGCRRDEIGMLRRSEISDDTITIPAARCKNKKAHIVPLSPLMRDLLSSVKANGSDQLFCNGRGLAWSRIKKRLDDALKFSTPFRLHDVRRSVATGMAGIGIAPDVIEACLNHQSGVKAGTAGTYNRYAYLPEKTAALARWSAHVSGLIEGHTARIVPMKAAARAVA
jgi:integrase